MISPEAMKAAHRIATEQYGSVGGNYAADAEIIDSEFTSLRAHLAAVEKERDRLRKACEFALHWLIIARDDCESEAQHKSFNPAIRKCRAALAAVQEKP